MCRDERSKPCIKLGIIVESPQVTSVELGKKTSTRDVDSSALLLCVLIFMIFSTLATLGVVVLHRGHNIILLQLLDLLLEVFPSDLLLSLREEIGLKRSQVSCDSIQLLVRGTLWVVDVAAN